MDGAARIRLIEVLNERRGATVSALTACFSVSQQRISQQLAISHEVGVVRPRRHGIHVRFELVDFTSWWVAEQLSQIAS